MLVMLKTLNLLRVIMLQVIMLQVSMLQAITAHLLTSRALGRYAVPWQPRQCMRHATQQSRVRVQQRVPSGCMSGGCPRSLHCAEIVLTALHRNAQLLHEKADKSEEGSV